MPRRWNPQPSRPLRRKPVQRERIEQQQGVEFLIALGAKPYVLGTTRAKKCWQCGALSRDMSTRQTPGISDVYIVLPEPGFVPPVWPLERPSRLVWWEVKAPESRDHQGHKVAEGAPSPDQLEFRRLVLEANGAHVIGPLNKLIEYLAAGGWVKTENLPHYRRPANG